MFRGFTVYSSFDNCKQSTKSIYRDHNLFSDMQCRGDRA